MATGGKHKSRYPESEEVKLSKALSSLLRHNFEKEGLKAQPGGYIFIDEMMALPKFKRYSLEQVKSIVDSNDKQRFSIEPHPGTGSLMIRANQGHSIKGIELGLNEITDASLYPIVIHGTYKKCIAAILANGLSRMGRNHIHFAPGMPGEDDVISGMRSSCQVVIQVDLESALGDGFSFFLSDNNVILCPGNDKGFLPTKYFKKVLDRKSGGNVSIH